jgi:hypothetical protein
MTTILSVDPGGTTGWCTFDAERFMSERIGPVPAEAEFADFLIRADHWLASNDRVTVVCERYVVSMETVKKSRGDVNWSMESIGVLRHLCRKYGHTFVLQNVADAKKLASNELLKQVGWWARGQDHGRDAIRHLILWLATNRPDVFKLLVQGA